MKQPGDDLVVRARTDREAFGQLYDAHYPVVFRYCFRRLFVRAVAEDVTSEVFVGVALKMPRFAGTTEEDFRRWLFRIATNEVNAYVRQSKRRRALLEAAARSGALPSAAGAQTGQSDVERLDWPVLYRAILTLKPRDQAILHLRFFEKMSHEQIADVLQERTATVRVELSRALEKLRACFNKAYSSRSA
jgi:RNA polymerase sigma-70 factor (ECF subfamily)